LIMGFLFLACWRWIKAWLLVYVARMMISGGSCNEDSEVSLLPLKKSPPSVFLSWYLYMYKIRFENWMLIILV
jgi:hypothetical protein